MPRRRTGYIESKKRNGKWWARVTYIDATGRRRDKRRCADRKGDLKGWLERTLAEAERTDGRSLEHERKTFADLAELYESQYAREAQYVEGRKVAGLRSARTIRGQLQMLKKRFGEMRLRAFTHQTLLDLRNARLNTPVERRCPTCIGSGGKCLTCQGVGTINAQRTITTVNRELSLLRRMLNIAVKLEWIPRNPFNAGDKMISAADEKERQRILTRDEEARLLAHARGTPARDRLRAIIIAALDTGMRQGELLKLTWADVDFATRRITVRAFNTKTLQQRYVTMTPRMIAELQRLQAEQQRPTGDALVFGVVNNVKRSFMSVRHAAGLDDVRFHDLRHTAATRLTRGQMPLAHVGRILGHTQLRTTYRYVSADHETLEQAAAILHAFTTTDDGEAAEKVN